MEEIWKDVTGYEGSYQISSLGRLRSLERTVVYSDGRKYFYPELMRKTHANRGYEYCTISINSKLVAIKIHRLVAEAFIPNPNDYPQVNHKDENKFNNKCSNLEWCDGKYNTNYGTAVERASKHMPRLDRFNLGKHLGKKIDMFDMNGNFLASFETIREAERKTGVLRMGISRCCRGIFSQSHGFRWSYASRSN